MQACANLPETGVVDEATWRALLGPSLTPLAPDALDGAPSPPPPPAGSEVDSSVSALSSGAAGSAPPASPPEWASLFGQPTMGEGSSGSATAPNRPVDDSLSGLEGFLKSAPVTAPEGGGGQPSRPAAQERPVDTLFGGFEKPAYAAPQAPGQGTNAGGSARQPPGEELTRPAPAAPGGAPALRQWPALRRDDGGLEVHYLHVRPDRPHVRP